MINQDLFWDLIRSLSRSYFFNFEVKIWFGKRFLGELYILN